MYPFLDRSIQTFLNIANKYQSTKSILKLLYHMPIFHWAYEFPLKRQKHPEKSSQTNLIVPPEKVHEFDESPNCSDKSDKSDESVKSQPICTQCGGVWNVKTETEKNCTSRRFEARCSWIKWRWSSVPRAAPLCLVFQDASAPDGESETDDGSFGGIRLRGHFVWKKNRWDRDTRPVFAGTEVLERTSMRYSYSAECAKSIGHRFESSSFSLFALSFGALNPWFCLNEVSFLR